MNTTWATRQKFFDKINAEFKFDLDVCALPETTRTNPPWWHHYVLKAHEIRFVVKKLAFDGPKDGVPFTGHALVVFRPGELPHHGPKCSSWYQNLEEIYA